MGTSKKAKNTARDSEFNAGGNINLGDTKTINVYGLEANKKDIEFVIKFFVLLMGLFAISSVLFLVFDPKNYIASIAAGGFFALLALLIVVLIRSKSQPINVN
ncbi:hypothetical protein SAMN06265375_10324 [Muriicola jejuensis]|uniref:Uncharacterized protein n=1 Tax=Muriicola jejuensis TaxID=504488 RepID=A0A6P0UMV1_9FLAO|nr:hypothetical protein [Muriicola jejuensis]NER11606.1 hypothetical protein [Muriicola jejuensis]SMP19313.1 hypothetical protein SAMN06265375_10324 [Muriicola jejuensis]